MRIFLLSAGIGIAGVCAMKGFPDLFPRRQAMPTIQYSLEPSVISAIPTAAQLLDDLVAEYPDEDSRFEVRKSGRGPPSHNADIRLFDAPEGFEPTVTFYRDKAAWCPYCEKVWLQLEEKRIPYRIQKSPLRCYGEKTKEHLRVNPSGMLPVIIINNKIIVESAAIMQELEDAFPTHKPLLPKRGSVEDSRVSQLLKLERRLFGVWFNWLTTRSFDGVDASIEAEMDSIVKQVDNELRIGGLYFLGKEISLVDVIFTPFLERMAASLPYYKGYEIRSPKYPHLLRWYEAMDEREAYRGIKSDYYTHAHALPPQIGQCHFLPKAQPFTADIDGLSWQLNFQGIEPLMPSSADLAKRDAARAILNNIESISRFASRNVGELGPSYNAILTNPQAVPNESIVQAVEVSLRIIAAQLLSTNETAEWPEVGAIGFPAELKACLLYLRDRVGVPRDMSVHGARQLRAHLNILINKLK